LAFAMQNFLNDLYNVEESYQAILYFKQFTRERERKGEKIMGDTNLLNDVTRVYLIEALT